MGQNELQSGLERGGNVNRNPTISDVQRRLVASEMFREAALRWMADDIVANLIAGAGYRNVLQNMVRKGEAVSPDDVKSAGLNSRMKVGKDFLAAMANDARTAVDRLEEVIQVAASSAMLLHNLRRMEEAGVTHFRLMSPKDERATEIERQMDGKRITINEARDLMRKHDIRRSVFRAIVEF